MTAMEQQQPYHRITVKVGSNVLTRPDGTLDVTRMSALVDQVADLRRRGIEVILVSSGAVASGRSEVRPIRRLDSVDQRQLFSAVGQAKLINRYYELFREHDIAVGQVLTTKESFGTRGHYLNQKNCMTVMLENGVIPIVNENDTISVSELMFTDNDELSGLIASMMDAQALIILSNVDGIYDGPPSDPASRVIPEIRPGDDFASCIQTSKSSFGRGGMLTKTSIARKVADEGITVIIANGRRENVLVEIVEAREEEILSNVAAQIRNSGYQDKLLAGVVISGAAANVQRLDKAVSAKLKAEKLRFVRGVPLDLHTAYADTVVRDGSLNVLLSLLNAGSHNCTSPKASVAVVPEQGAEETGVQPAGYGQEAGESVEAAEKDNRPEERQEPPKPRKKSRIKEWLEKVTKTITEE